MLDYHWQEPLVPGPDEKHHLVNGVRDASGNWKRQRLQQFDNI